MLKIGHRGVRGLAPENTKASFEKALESDLDMVELDLQLTKDKEVVVIHDYDLERIAGVKAKVAELTLAELREFDLGSYFADDLAKQEIMRLQEVINLVRGDLKLNIELKMIPEAAELLVDKVQRILRREDFIAQTIISSFNHCYLKEFGPEFKTAILINSHPVEPVAMIESANADGIHPNYKLLTASLLEKVKQVGYFVNVWTVNKREEINKLKKLGVDGVVTDDPLVFK